MLEQVQEELEASKLAPLQNNKSLVSRMVVLAQSDQLFVLLGSLLNSVFSFLSNLAMAKVLSPGDYGIFVSCVSLFNLVVLLASTVQTTSARLAAQQVEEHGHRFIWLRLRTNLTALTLLGLAFFVLLLPATPLLANFLHIDAWLIVLLLLGLLIFAPYALLLGTLQGLQSFKLFSGSLAFSSLARLASALTLALLGLNLAGAVISLPLALGLSLILNLFILGWLRRGQAKSFEPTEAERLAPASLWQVLQPFLNTGWLVLLGTFGLTFLVTSDVIMVQHFFAGEVAGQYGIVATLGKVVMYLSAPITVILLPKVAQALVWQENVVGLLRRGLLGTLGLGLLALVGLLLGGGLVISFFTKNSPAELGGLLVLHGGAMLLYSLGGVWIAFFISIGQRLYLLLLAPILVAQIGLFYVWHGSLFEVITSMYVTGLGMCLLGEACLWRYKRRMKLLRNELNPPNSQQRSGKEPGQGSASV